jgi:hypothetical protein
MIMTFCLFFVVVQMDLTENIEGGLFSLKSAGAYLFFVFLFDVDRRALNAAQAPIDPLSFSHTLSIS